MGGAVWLNVLVEDKATKQFAISALRRLGLGHHEFDVLSLPTEPSRYGRRESQSRDMRSWVNHKFPDALRMTNSRLAKRQNVALLVVADADGSSVADRKAELREATQLHERGGLTDGPRIFYWIPKYHIETWATYFSGDTEVNEDDKYKHGSRLRDDSFAVAGRLFVDCWRAHDSVPAQLPALNEALLELGRLARWKRGG